MLRDFDLEQIGEPLIRWFSEHARALPWRDQPAPYRVWVSEIMLQQTRVEAVRPYFERFMEELPDIPALAACPEDRLMKLWEGLGYYNRVRNMQTAAGQVMENYNGILPADYESLLKLKGIGHYTAGAVASIAYGIAVPAVDGNVLRVITRVTGDNTDIMKQSFRSEVEAAMEKTIKQLNIPETLKGRLRGGNVPGAFNQALMDLGATVCVPNGAPLCGECPWQEFCCAKAQGLTGQIPVKSKAKERRIEKRTVLILRDGDKVAIRKRQGKGLLAGLYELPNLEGELSSEEVLSYVKELQYEPIRIQKLSPAKHIFSHIEWHMSGYAVLLEEEGMRDAGEMEDAGVQRKRLIFVEASDAKERYAIPSAFAAYAEYMNIKLGNERLKEERAQKEDGKETEQK